MMSRGVVSARIVRLARGQIRADEALDGGIARVAPRV